MVASLNDVSAFDTPKTKLALVETDSCSTCLRKGYTYVYDTKAKSNADPPFFKSYKSSETPAIGKCCEVDGKGKYTCSTSTDAKRDIIWETLQYKGLQEPDPFCKVIPELREIIDKLYVGGQDVVGNISSGYFVPYFTRN